MAPTLKTIRHALRRTTEALATELAHPGGATPPWSAVEWRVAMAASAAHGVSALLHRRCAWRDRAWRRFLASQREHVWHRHQRIAALLGRLDADARTAGVPMVALKGAALHALGFYARGERPMADIDLLVREADAAATMRLLEDAGYVESFAGWKHRAFAPAASRPVAALGEHRDTPVNIELHTRIQERLPLAVVDISAQIHPQAPWPGLNPYPSNGALMAHLLLHAAGNLCNRSLRLLHLHDIALLSSRMRERDWEPLWNGPSGAAWWAFAPACLVARYYGAIPATVLERLWHACPPVLRMVARRQTLTGVSCSELWHHTLHGVEWLHSCREVSGYIGHRLHPPRAARDEHADLLRTQLWLQGKSWATRPRAQRLLALLARPMPRMDTLYVVRAALADSAPGAGAERAPFSAGRRAETPAA